MSVVLFNPSIATENVGDLIIIDSVLRELETVFPSESIVSLPTQDRIGMISKAIAEKAAHRIVGGTNLLSSYMLKFKQWKINLLDTLRLNDVTLMGVGWWQYQGRPDFYTKLVLNRVLSGEKFHSVRDGYTKLKLESIGIGNVINTGCPTMWALTSEHCNQIPKIKAENVVFTLTDYNKLSSSDLELIYILKQKYSKVYFWPQGSGDLNYIKTLNPSGVEIIPKTLKAFDDLLKKESSLDFVGTRLHGGVRALQNKKRTLILAVDNRAKEISKDTNLPVVDRKDTSAINEWISKDFVTEIVMDFAAIDKWRNQSSFLLK